MTNSKTTVLPDSDIGIDEAASLLRAGKLVAFPTETVYGLGADARNDIAVAEIFQAKGRPSFNPLIVHVADLQAARDIGQFDQTSLRLAQAFWPGPLTLVVPLRPDAGIASLVSAGLSSVAIRVPAHPLAQRLLTAFAGPVAAPSANPSGKLSPTTSHHVLVGLDGRLAAVLDGGSCPVGVESTIIRTAPVPVLLRPGGLPKEVIEQCLGQDLAQAETDATAPDAPGQLLSHYAPGARLRLNATKARQGEVMLGFGPVDGTLNLSRSGDLLEAAANLFSDLQKLDAMAPDRIAVAPIPDHGLGLAINDRLKRAAAPRPG